MLPKQLKIDLRKLIFLLNFPPILQKNGGDRRKQWFWLPLPLLRFQCCSVHSKCKKWYFIFLYMRMRQWLRKKLGTRNVLQRSPENQGKFSVTPKDFVTSEAVLSQTHTKWIANSEYNKLKPQIYIFGSFASLQWKGLGFQVLWGFEMNSKNEPGARRCCRLYLSILVNPNSLKYLRSRSRFAF